MCMELRCNITMTDAAVEDCTVVLYSYMFTEYQSPRVSTCRGGRWLHKAILLSISLDLHSTLQLHCIIHIHIFFVYL